MRSLKPAPRRFRAPAWSLFSAAFLALNIAGCADESPADKEGAATGAPGQTGPADPDDRQAGANSPAANEANHPDTATPAGNGQPAADGTASNPLPSDSAPSSSGSAGQPPIKTADGESESRTPKNGNGAPTDQSAGENLPAIASRPDSSRADTGPATAGSNGRTKDGRPSADPAGRLKQLGAKIVADGDGRVIEVNLSGTNVADADLAALNGSIAIDTLYLDGTNITDAGLADLKGLTNLERLALHDTKVTGTGLESLKPMSKLRVLNLTNCAIDDDSLVHLKDLTGIETLSLQGTPINGSGLKHVAGLVNLITLNLNETKLDPGTLLHLEGLEKLRIIYLHDADADEQDIDDLEEIVSGLAIFTD